MLRRSSIPRLSVLLPGLIAIWATAIVLLHGPVFLLYIALHCVTTGVFAALMWVSERRHVRPVSLDGSIAAGNRTTPVSANTKHGELTAAAVQVTP